MIEPPVDPALVEVGVPVREFLRRTFPKRTFGDHDDIFAVGVTSLFAMQLVLFVEKQFGLVIDHSDLDRATFGTIDGITALVRRKATSVGSAS